MSGDAGAFNAIAGELDGPAYVVTTTTGAERDGCLVAFATRCSIEPPRFGVWLSKPNRTYRTAFSAATLVVHVLRRGDEDLARLFGAETGDDVDKFQAVEWSPGPDGVSGARPMRLHGGRCDRSGRPQLGVHGIGDVEAGHAPQES